MSREYIIDLSEVETKSYSFRDAFSESIVVKGPIVRCRDCKHMFDWENGRMLCRMWTDGAKFVFYPTVSADDFCSKGERR